jgi:hypothetical protein
MEYLGRQLPEEEIDELYKVLFTQTAIGPLVLAHLVHDECHLWDEIDPDPQLVTRQNLARRVLKRTGLVRESNLFELTRRLVEAPGAAPLREKTQ